MCAEIALMTYVILYTITYIITDIKKFDQADSLFIVNGCALFLLSIATYKFCVALRDVIDYRGEHQDDIDISGYDLDLDEAA